ncbi:MAG: hypothetical protein KAW02_00950 [candidate division Zixibacteria bacterium]|nr:hypothetical protein [candidate division Zixibacteria bacterium]
MEALFVRFRKGRKKKISLSEDVIILANFALVDDGDPSGITSSVSRKIDISETSFFG